ncbi:MAG: potassium channel protein [bacterium]
MKTPKKLLQIMGLLVMIFLTGLVGYRLIEGWPWFDALYMTVITLATVGYGETHQLSNAGRAFTIFLILGGMGIILYGITEVTSFIVEGEMSGFLRRRRMNKLIGKLSGHYILCGYGGGGHYVLEEMIRTKRKCVVIEKDSHKVHKLLEEDHLVVEGDATQDPILLAAGVDRAAGLITAMPTDMDNLFVVISARGLNPKLRIIAKVQDIASREKFLRSGADAAVSASYIGGLRMVSELVRPETTSFLDTMLRDDSALRVEDVKVGQRSKVLGKSIGQCEPWSQHEVILVSLKKQEIFHFNPSKDLILEAGDTLVVIGNPDQLHSLREALG